jgi:hypothetical protein
MDDYAALVERVCFVLPKVFGCLLLSDDGMVLSGYPDEGVNVAEAAWRHFCALDEPLRGFLAFGDQHWAYVRHGAYAVFVVADVSVRPGVMIDRLEQTLSTAAISREAGTFKLPEAQSPTPLGGKPAPEPRAPDPVAPAPTHEPAHEPTHEPAHEPTHEPAPAMASSPAPTEPEHKKGDKKADKKESKKDAAPAMQPNLESAPVPEPASVPEPAEVAASIPAAVSAPVPPEATTEAAAPAGTETQAIDFGLWARPRKNDLIDDDEEEEETEVDRVQLAQEFSGLLQMDGGFDEGSS